MKQDFDSTVWIIHTILLTAAFGISIPIVRALVGLALLRLADFTGSRTLRRAALATLPTFLKPLIGITAAVAISSPLHAYAQTPTISLDRIPSVSQSVEKLPDQESAEISVATTDQPELNTGLYIVQPGDSLWSIARRTLAHSHPSAHDIDRAWRNLWLKNRAAIGPDPSLIKPGTALEIVKHV